MEPYPSGQFGFMDDPDCQFGNGTVWTRTRTRSDGPEPLLTLLGSTYFHGVNLRFLNIYGDGERQSHGIRLIEAVLHEAPHFAELKLCYDIACVFESALYRYNLDWMEVVEARIGRIHIYGHEYQCHVLYNLLHTANYGLMVGEEPEHLWYMMQHLIRSGRVSSSSRRMQKIDSFGRYWPI